MMIRLLKWTAGAATLISAVLTFRDGLSHRLTYLGSLGWVAYLALELLDPKTDERTRSICLKRTFGYILLSSALLSAGSTLMFGVAEPEIDVMNALGGIGCLLWFIYASGPSGSQKHRLRTASSKQSPSPPND